VSPLTSEPKTPPPVAAANPLELPLPDFQPRSARPQVEFTGPKPRAKKEGVSSMLPQLSMKTHKVDLGRVHAIMFPEL